MTRKNRVSTLFFSLALCIFISGCVDTEGNKGKLTIGYQSDKQLLEKDNEMYPCYSISEGRTPTIEDFNDESEALKRLRKLEPITIPTKDVNPTTAQQRRLIVIYKGILEKYRSDKAMIRQFRSIYAKLLLVTYDVLETGNTGDAAYLIGELIESETGRFKFILTGLRKLSKKDKYNAERLAKLVEPQINRKIEALKLAKQTIEDMQMIGDTTNDTEKRNDTYNKKSKFLLAAFSRAEVAPDIEELEKYHQEIIGCL